MKVILPETEKIKKSQMIIYIFIIVICIISIIIAFYVQFYARIDLGRMIGIEKPTELGNKTRRARTGLENRI